MRILLDTHILIWAADDKLPPKALPIILDKTNILLFSPASIWEIVIKYNIKRANFSGNPSSLYNALISAGYQELPINGRHALHVLTLPLLHKDPFDRILLAQAAYEGIPFMTSDNLLSKYSDSIIFIEK